MSLCFDPFRLWRFPLSKLSVEGVTVHSRFPHSLVLQVPVVIRLILPMAFKENSTELHDLKLFKLNFKFTSETFSFQNFRFGTYYGLIN